MSNGCAYIASIDSQLFGHIFTHVNYGSGTVNRINSGQKGRDAVLLHVHSADGSTFMHETMSRLLSRKSDIKVKIRLRPLMHM